MALHPRHHLGSEEAHLLSCFLLTTTLALLSIHVTGPLYILSLLVILSKYHPFVFFYYCTLYFAG